MKCENYTKFGKKYLGNVDFFCVWKIECERDDNSLEKIGMYRQQIYSKKFFATKVKFRSRTFL